MELDTQRFTLEKPKKTWSSRWCLDVIFEKRMVVSKEWGRKWTVHAE